MNEWTDSGQIDGGVDDKWCSSFLSVSGIKAMTKSNLEKERVYSLPGHCPSLRDVRPELKQKLKAEPTEEC